MQQLHKIMVERPDDFVMDNYLHDSLSYGHSNGWIERLKDFREDIISKYIVYHSMKEDSVQVVQSGKTAYIRFLATIDVSLNGVRNTYRLRVLEVWVRKGNWKLFARQAVKA